MNITHETNQLVTSTSTFGSCKNIAFKKEFGCRGCPYSKITPLMAEIEVVYCDVQNIPNAVVLQYTPPIKERKFYFSSDLNLFQRLWDWILH